MYQESDLPNVYNTYERCIENNGQKKADKNMQAILYKIQTKPNAAKQLEAQTGTVIMFE